MGKSLQKYGLIVSSAWLLVANFLLQAGEIRGLNFSSTTPACFVLFEATFKLDSNYNNPFDPDEIRVDALIKGPDGSCVIPCFYQVPVKTSNWQELVADAGWSLRHAFQKEGKYQLRFMVTDRDVWESETFEVTVKGVKNHGFVQFKADASPYWSLSDGMRFWPSGCNAAWSSGDLIGDYKRYVDLFADNGISVMRVWLVGFARQELEWSNTLWDSWNRRYGLGRYNQKTAAWLDWLVEYAAARGVYLQLVIEQHGEWSSEIDSNWEFNPYNRDHGGFLFTPAEYFTSPRARKLALARYRYIVARWGYATSIAAWELFNEADLTDAFRTLGLKNEIATWHREVANFFKTHDPAKRIVATSANNLDLLAEIARQSPAIDILHFHIHDSQPARAMEQMISDWQVSGLKQPLVCGEFGLPFENGDSGDSFYVRRTIWQAACHNLPAWYWYWGLLETNGALKNYAAFHKFWQNQDKLGWKPVSARVVDAPRHEILRLWPDKAWKTSKKTEFEIDNFAECAGIEQLSAFLQGTWQPKMPKSVEFTAPFNADGRFIVAVESASDIGTNQLAISVDDRLLVRRTLTKNGFLGVTLGAGTHRIMVENSGHDWIKISYFELNGLNADAIKVNGLRTDSDQMMLYLSDLRGAMLGRKSGLTLEIANIEPGVYNLEFVDLFSSICFARATERASAGFLRCRLPAFRGDLAIAVVRVAP